MQRNNQLNNKLLFYSEGVVLSVSVFCLTWNKAFAGHVGFWSQWESSFSFAETCFRTWWTRPHAMIRRPSKWPLDYRPWPRLLLIWVLIQLASCHYEQEPIPWKFVPICCCTPNYLSSIQSVGAFFNHSTILDHNQFHGT